MNGEPDNQNPGLGDSEQQGEGDPALAGRASARGANGRAVACVPLVPIGIACPETGWRWGMALVPLDELAFAVLAQRGGQG